jgi:hypothetical protein
MMRDAIRTSRTLRWVLLWLQLCMGESLLGCVLDYWPLALTSAASVGARTENIEMLAVYNMQC